MRAADRATQVLAAAGEQNMLLLEEKKIGWHIAGVDRAKWVLAAAVEHDKLLLEDENTRRCYNADGGPSYTGTCCSRRAG